MSGLPIGVYLGICGPIECTEDDYNSMDAYLARLGNQILDDLDIQQAYFQQDLTEDNFNFYDSVKQNHEVRKWSTGHFVSFGIGLFLVLCVLLATLFEIIQIARYSAVNSLGVNEEQSQRFQCAKKFLNAFRLLENSKKLLFARNKEGDKNLELLNGLRVISMFWIILGHTYFYGMDTALLNPLVPIDFIQSFSFNLVSSAPYAVDIFFWLSGFLGVYIMLAAMKKKRGRMQPFYMIYLHRYLRIVPLYAVTMLFFWYLMSSVGSGPIFFLYYKERAVHCENTWWVHFIFLNNFYEIKENANACMGWTWYLPNDFQFFLLIPLLVFLLYHKRIFGMIFIITYQIVCFAVTIFVAYEYNLRPSYLEATDNYYTLYYHRPYIRIPPFTIGVMAALFLYCFKNEEPEVSPIKRIMDRIYASRVIRFIFYIVGLILVLGMIFIFYPINNYPDDFSDFFNVMFLTFSRALFILGMTMILLPGLMGRAWVLRSFLALDMWTPLARLTFGAYLIHPTYMIFNSLNTYKGEYMTTNTGIVKFLCWAVVSFATSLAFTLVVETPFMLLEKTFLLGGGKKSKKSSKVSLKGITSSINKLINFYIEEN